MFLDCFKEGEVQFYLVMEYPVVELDAVGETGKIETQIDYVFGRVDGMLEDRIENVSALNEVELHVLADFDESFTI